MAKRADIQNDLLRPNHLPAVAVPVLQIRGWAGVWGWRSSSKSPEISGGPVCKIFLPSDKGLGKVGGGGHPDPETRGARSGLSLV